MFQTQTNSRLNTKYTMRSIGVFICCIIKYSGIAYKYVSK
jgi:hypothetical protein